MQPQWSWELRLQKAFEFVERNGFRPTQAMAANAMGLMDADATLAEVVAAYQNDDGGWHRFDSDMPAPLSTVSQTHIGLQLLLWIDPREGHSLNRTVAFLKNAQHSTGAWDEPQEILQYDPPPWMVPGDQANQLWLTSAVCAKLLEHRRQADVRFERALAFLRAGWDGEQFPRYTHTHWMALSLFSRLPEPSGTDRRIAEGCKQILIDRLSHSKIDPIDIGDIAYAALRAGSMASDLYHKAIEKVLSSQADDGGWRTGYGDTHRVWATISAMYLLKMVKSYS